MKARTEVVLWAAQRVSAMVLAVCVLIHLIMIVYAVRHGLSATQILGRTRGNGLWAGFYALFVVMVAVHAPIGLRTVLAEWCRWRGASRDFFVLLFGIALALFGLRAVFAVFL
ncbi:MAG TPA: succinate dehydrogenase [Burkholderiales bacterium]|nr:succinate dehydrogenase [Burkholderiales bacterium]